MLQGLMVWTLINKLHIIYKHEVIVSQQISKSGSQNESNAGFKTGRVASLQISAGKRFQNRTTLIKKALHDIDNFLFSAWI